MQNINYKLADIKRKYYFDSERIRLNENRELFSKNYPANNPLITIILPTYNRCDILFSRALPSILAQSYKNFELIIIGDGCTDATDAKISEIQDSRIRFYNIPYRGYRYPETPENHWFAGPVLAINFGLMLVNPKSLWIARIDDDEVWGESHLEDLLNYANENDLEFVSGGNYELRYGAKHVILGEHAESVYYYPSLKVENNNSPLIGCVSTWLYRSYLKFFSSNEDCWRKEHNKVNDIDLSIRFYEAGVRMGHIGRAMISVEPRPGESTIGLDSYLENSEKIMEKYKNDSNI